MQATRAPRRAGEGCEGEAGRRGSKACALSAVNPAHAISREQGGVSRRRSGVRLRPCLFLRLFVLVSASVLASTRARFASVPGQWTAVHDTDLAWQVAGASCKTARLAMVAAAHTVARFDQRARRIIVPAPHAAAPRLPWRERETETRRETLCCPTSPVYAGTAARAAAAVRRARVVPSRALEWSARRAQVCVSGK